MKEYWIDPSFEKDLVSVIIPCHNQDRYLSECLESVIKQEYRPLEIVIIDDGSTDGTRKIMNEFQSANFENIVVKCYNQPKQGAQHARNHGCRQARGEFIQFLDGDDVLIPSKLIEQVQVLKRDSEIDVVYGDFQFLVDFGSNGARKGKVVSSGTASDIVASMLFGPLTTSFSYLCRRSAIQVCGPWDINLKIAQDIDYFLRMAINGCRFYYKKGLTGFYRKHSFQTISEQSVSIRGRTIQKILMEAESYLRKQGKLNEYRVRSMIDCYRRNARKVYMVDRECFNNLLDNILRLCPKYLPEKSKARFIASIIGFRNYEVLAAVIILLFSSKKEKAWL